MIKTRINNEYKDIIKIFGGGTLQKEIIKVWSKEAQEYVYGSSVEYTGSFPIAINTNGDVLLDYRIYGADGGVGERTENLIDASLSEQTIEIKPSTQYNISRYLGSYSQSAPDLRFSIYDENDNLLWSDYLGTWLGENIEVFDNAKYFKIIIPNRFLNAVSLIEGKRPKGLSTREYPYPANYIPYGYKLPMTVNNGITNIVPPTPAETKTLNGITITSDGKGTYTISGTATATLNQVDFYFDSPISCGDKNTFAIFNNFTSNGVQFAFIGQSGTFALLVPNRVFYDIAVIANRNLRGFRFSVVAGTTVNGKISPLIFDGVNITPTEFVPYTPPIKYDAPVYIGENQLEEGEYVSYSEQKIYRDVSGTLTPTDPPVPLPEIPTIKGETIIDYDGTPKPSQMYVKYRR